MDELAEWIQFHPKSPEQRTSSVQIIQVRFSNFDRRAPLFHIADSRKICSASYSLPPIAALWNTTDSLQPLKSPIAMTSPPIVTERAQSRDAPTCTHDADGGTFVERERPE